MKLTQQGLKYDIYKQVKNLKNLDEGKRVYIKDDIPQEISQQRQELRCFTATARDRGYEATVRGGAIIVDNKHYAYSDIEDLPKGISLENAKMVAVEDGTAFQSHYPFRSSMFPCEIDL